ncbi:uncharacterized protein BDZ99DRAFT_483190 [Mytilinidion resinicola]|uniref:Uncharacterized protein n=1 Tax=Mytilinidion resinicola TaxID=574789 RepID=A0A6A6Y0U2_9PEZI|nr:uncharacterized protein BDZ99DRAFT_483190 [Mytilinidion resinicola]KAF2802178.1 hypothetical protein BDZ99DRAFT_483190 [Mytilinidion resinicola]
MLQSIFRSSRSPTPTPDSAALRNGVVNTSPTLKHRMWKDQLERLRATHESQGRHVNPIVEHFFSICGLNIHRIYGLGRTYWDCNHEGHGMMVLYFAHEPGNPIQSGGFEHKDASCRNMFLTIRSDNKLHISVQYPRRQMTWGTSTIQNANGIRIGDFLDAFRDIKELGQRLKRIEKCENPVGCEGWIVLIWKFALFSAALWAQGFYEPISTVTTFRSYCLHLKGIISDVRLSYETECQGALLKLCLILLIVIPGVKGVEGWARWRIDRLSTGPTRIVATNP